MTKYAERKIRRLVDRMGGKRCAVLNYAKAQERYLESVCRKVWEHTTRQGTRYVFGSYLRDGEDKTDNTIVTLAYFNRSTGNFLPVEFGC